MLISILLHVMGVTYVRWFLLGSVKLPHYGAYTPALSSLMLLLVALAFLLCCLPKCLSRPFVVESVGLSRHEKAQSTSSCVGMLV